MANADLTDLIGRMTQARVGRRLVHVLAVIGVGIVTGVGIAAVIRIPSVASIDDFTPGLTTEVRDRSGTLFRTWASERREILDENEIPAVLREAILAAEDKNFYQHGGVDLGAIIRSSIIDIQVGELSTGASTLTMQLARTYFQLTREARWSRKIEEALLAVEIEKRMSKDQILTLYLNVMNFGGSPARYGAKAATRYYFDKDVADLTLTEAAMLTAILPAPSRLNPHRRPEAVTRRRNWTLDRMLRAGVITAEAHAAATAAPLGLVVRRQHAEPGPYFAEEIRRHLETSYGVDSILRRGLHVDTTLDLEVQRVAQRALRDGLAALDRRKGWRDATHVLEEDPATATLASWGEAEPKIGDWIEGVVTGIRDAEAAVRIGSHDYTLAFEDAKWTGVGSLQRLLEPGEVILVEILETPPPTTPPPAAAAADSDAEPPAPGAEESLARRVALRQEPEMEGALVMIESATGAVRALVGGWDFDRSHFNRVTQAKRQVGSAFKPFLYGAALEAGYTPADTLFDAPVAFPGAAQQLTYSPRNYGREYLGIITLRKALEKSINVTATKVLDMVGAERVIDFARRCGIEGDLQPFPSLALGTADLTPLEVAAAYATIANQGVKIEPFLIERITTREGLVLEEHIPQATEVVSPQVAYVLTHMLRGVFQRGTAASAASIEVPVGGKTGTTDSYTDAWFAGFTPRYTLLVWVGYDQVRYLGRGMTGAVAALPIWRQVVETGIQDGWIDPDERFPVPPGVSTRRVEYDTGLLASAAAQHTIEEVFLAGTEPVQLYDPSWARIVALPWYQQRPFYGLPKAGERMPEDVQDWTLVQERWEAKDDPDGAEGEARKAAEAEAAEPSQTARPAQTPAGAL